MVRNLSSWSSAPKDIPALEQPLQCLPPPAVKSVVIFAAGRLGEWVHTFDSHKRCRAQSVEIKLDLLSTDTLSPPVPTSTLFYSFILLKKKKGFCNVWHLASPFLLPTASQADQPEKNHHCSKISQGRAAPSSPKKQTQPHLGNYAAACETKVLDHELSLQCKELR